MTEYHFETHEPRRPVRRDRQGHRPRHRCTDTTETHRRRRGPATPRRSTSSRTAADQRRSRPRQRAGFFGGDTRSDVDVAVPTSSDLADPAPAAPTSPSTGTSAHAQVQERLRRRAPRRPVEGHLLVETGSGDVRVDDVQRRPAGQERLRRRRASATPAAPVSISTGSGDVDRSGRQRGTPSSRPGSGDLSVGAAHDDTSLSTGSGDLSIDLRRPRPAHRQGRLRRRAIGVKAGRPGVDRHHHGVRHHPLRAQGAGQPAGGPGPHRGPRQDRQRRHRPERGLSTTHQSSTTETATAVRPTVGAHSKTETTRREGARP